MDNHDAPTIIGSKRDGYELSSEQINWVVKAFTEGRIADEQMSALAMAIFFQGLNEQELSVWTSAMIDTGERLNFSGLRHAGVIVPTVDKHSTGGVGDKITLPLTPLVAACGAVVPQLSGRGLGHTGGTLDKLEAIPGWKADLTASVMHKILADPTIGAVICAAGPFLAPADKKLYALRDITSTVESIPLIASSIMSKKIAEGTDSLVLDVKVGSGAFMKSCEKAQELAHRMVVLGHKAGVKTTAVLTSMDTPLGLTVGNSLEVQEALEVLAGGGPEDIIELTLVLAREMLQSAGIDGIDPADRLRDGSAMDRWRKMIAAQGGNPYAALPVAKHTQTITAPISGIMARLDALSVGVAAWKLGAGRNAPGASVDPGAGVRLHVKAGDSVIAGQPLFTLYTNTAEAFAPAIAELNKGWEIGTDIPPTQPLVLGRISLNYNSFQA
ncbi:MAG: thymidine phosphorylase [Mycobacteriaceae bacterium]